MADSQFQSPFQILGIDVRNQEQIFADNLKERQAELEDIRTDPQKDPNLRLIEAAGRGIGNAVGDRLGHQQQLDPEQEKMQAIMTTTQDRIAQGQANGDFTMEDGSHDSLKEGEARQRFIAEELLRSGDMRGIQLLQQLDSISRGRRTQDLELERLVEGNENLRSQRLGLHARTDAGKQKALRDNVNTYWFRNNPDPVSSFEGVMTADGQGVLGPEGRVIPFAELTAYAPPDPNKIRSGKVLTANDYGISDSEAKAIRQEAGAISQQMRGAIRMKNSLADSIGADGSLNIMDGSGKLTSGIVTALDFVSAIGRQTETALREAGVSTDAGISDGDFAGKDLGNNAVSGRYARENMAELDGLFGDLVPPTLRNSATNRAEYYATLTQLVYARARTNEPGARQLSDADFKNAMMGLAGTASDPETFRQVMMGNIVSDWQNFNDKFLALPDPVRAQNMVISRAGQANYEDTFKLFAEQFTGDFGTADAPTGNLTGSQGDQSRSNDAAANAAGVETGEEVLDDAAVLDAILAQ